MKMLNVCETMLLNLRTNLLQSKRTNHEIECKLHELFESNKKDFDNSIRYYGKSVPQSEITIFDVVDHELELVENFKKQNNIEYSDCDV